MCSNCSFRSISLWSEYQPLASYQYVNYVCTYIVSMNTRKLMMSEDCCVTENIICD